VTHEEKAKALVDKFITPTKNWMDEEGWITDTESAKECAIICVKEIMNEHHNHGFNDRYDYWSQVLSHLQKQYEMSNESKSLVPEITSMLDGVFNEGVDRCVTHLLYATLDQQSFFGKEPQKSELTTLIGELKQLKTKQ
jgi:hypothetical protein